MSNETYLNHPNFGLLFRICPATENQELYTTLYAQRLFFLVTISQNNLIFEPINRSNVRLIIENRLRNLRNNGFTLEYEQLSLLHKQTF